MGKMLGIALGAGVASALLFIVSATASLAAVALAYLAPLPIMIAALGFGHLSGAVAAMVGGCTVALALGPVSGLTFVVVLGLPAWWLAYVSLLGRSDPAALPGLGGGAVEWYPLGKIVAWTAALSAIPVLVIGAGLVLHYGGYSQAEAAISSRLEAVFGGAKLPGGLSFKDLVRAAPVAMAASTFIMLSFNLWLGGRVVLVSQKLKRPWPNVADGIRLPRQLAGVLFLSLGCVFLPEPFGLTARVVAAALAMAFVLEGLAAAHVVTRGLLARRLILFGIYATVVFLMPWPLLALSVLGCIDCLFSLRGRSSPLPPSPPFRS